MRDLCNNIAKLSLEQFNKLPKTGKPSKNQWTILSTIVQENCDLHKLEVVSLGTGTKCIGKNKMSAKGHILNDSHAEIICRRSFLLYLYCQIKLCLNDEHSIFKINKSKTKFSLSDKIVFHFFTTHTPCGDAAIFPKNTDTNFGESLVEENLEIPNKRIKLIEEDIHRTGAKCLRDSKVQDPHLDGEMYHNVSLIRTKPGRGDPTLSVSCSDKIMKWSYIGMQGALISVVLEKPIYLKSVTIGAGVPFSKESLNRAFNTRFQSEVTLPNFYHKTDLLINQAIHEFKFSKSANKQPCPSSISWYKDNESFMKAEIAIEGMKQGVTKKKINTKQARLKISKIELYRCFLGIIGIIRMEEFKEPLTYLEAKLKANDYQQAWKTLKQQIFKIWTVKDSDLSCFYLD